MLDELTASPSELQSNSELLLSKTKTLNLKNVKIYTNIILTLEHFTLLPVLHCSEVITICK